MASEPRLPFDAPPSPPDPLIVRDEAARAFAVDPSRNVVLEASAGTGKTHVLVTRYINLLQGRRRSGEHPRDHVHAEGRRRDARADRRASCARMAHLSPADDARWQALRDRLVDISISTIDAFCFALLREFPLEADLDPGFDVADETVMPRLVEEALDGALRAARRMAVHDAGRRAADGGARRAPRRGSGLASAPRSAAVGRADDSPLPRLGRRARRRPTRSPARCDGCSRCSRRSTAASRRSSPTGRWPTTPMPCVAADLRAVAAGFGAGPGAAAGEADGPQPARAVLDRVSRYFLKDDGGARSRPATAS